MSRFVGVIVLRHLPAQGIAPFYIERFIAVNQPRLVAVSQLPNLVGVLIEFIIRLAHIDFQIGRGCEQNDFDARLLRLFPARESLSNIRQGR